MAMGTLWREIFDGVFLSVPFVVPWRCDAAHGSSNGQPGYYFTKTKTREGRIRLETAATLPKIREINDRATREDERRTPDERYVVKRTRLCGRVWTFPNQ